MNLFRRIRLLLLLIFIFSPVISSFAGVLKLPDENILISRFFKSLYNFSFREADSIVLVMNDSNIDNIIFSNIKANLAWWKLLSGDEIETNLIACNSNIDESISLSLKNDHPDINTRLNIIYSYSLKARLENYKGNTLKSLINFYKSIDYIGEINRGPVKDEKMNLVLGMYYYFVDYIEKKYFILNALFFPFPKGDKDRGLMYLEKCSSSGDEIVNTEANYFLLKIYGYTERDYSKAYLKVLLLTRQHPNNLVYSLDQLRLLIKMNKTGDAQIFRKKLIEEIQTAKNINRNQKNHFISQIGDISITSLNSN